MTAIHPLPEAPRSFLVGDEWQIGVFRTPFTAPELSAKSWRRFRLKEWHYVSFTTEEWYVAVGLVQLGYIADLFAYAVDRTGNTKPVEVEALSPMGRALSFAPSSVNGTTSWKSRTAAVIIEADQGWNVELDIPLGKERLRGRAHVETRDSLSMLHRLSPRRFAYTHKAAGWPASGYLELGNRPIVLDGALAASDWTRSQANRITEWKWACFSGRLRSGADIGLNLSAQVYDDEKGHSRENALWIDGEVRSLSGVRFEVPSRPKEQPWSIHSIKNDEVEMHFEPQGAREQHMNLGLMRTDFVQPYGTFSGQVCGHNITGCFGVVEVHLSVW